MYPTNRIQLFDKDCNPIRELAPREVLSRIRHEEINGEHTLTIETTRHLEVGWRALTVDATGRWREWVVEEPDETHDSGLSATGTYRLVWSIQYDLSHTYDYEGNLGHREVGIAHAASGSEAVAMAIRGTKRWVVGTCDVQPCEVGKGVVMIAESAWDCLDKVVKAWGGEIDATIEVGLDGVTARRVDLREHIGSTEPTRRFEWGRDLTSISRKADPGPYYCRVVPIGKTHKEYAEGNGDEDTYEFDWPLSILDDPEYNPTIFTEYIEDEDAALVFRVSDGKGGWEYPTKIVKYDQDDVQLLYEEALEDLHNHTRPHVTYEASVVQLYEAGMDPRGTNLGDEIQVVDWGFNPDYPLAIQERVTDVKVDELDDNATELVIGEKRDSLIEKLAGMTSIVSKVSDVLDFIDTDAYVEALLDRINKEINATGGYSYLVPGEGLLTFDVAVRDPLNPIEASLAVQVKGGSIRIANSRKANGDWDWKSVFQSGHIVTELVTSGMIETGYVGNPNGNSYWDLDGDILRIGSGTVVGDDDQTMGALINGVWSKVTGVQVQTQWVQTDTYVPNAYAGEWLYTPPELKPGMSLWKRDEVTIHTTLGTTTTYRNVKKVYSAANMLSNADNPTDLDLYLANAYVEDGIIKLHTDLDGETRFYAMWRTDYLDYDDYEGHTIRLSFDVRRMENSSSRLSVTFALMNTESAEDGYFPDEVDEWRSAAQLITPGYSFSRKTVSCTIPSLSETEGRWVAIVFSLSGSTDGIEIRDVSLEDQSTESYDSATPMYYLSSSDEETLDGEWLTEPPLWEDGHCIWTRTVLVSGNTTVYTDPDPIIVYGVLSATDNANMSSDMIRGIGEGLTVTRSELTMAVMDASRIATDYLTYRNGKLILGATDSAIKNVMTNSLNSFEMNGRAVAYFGYDDDSRLWQMYIANAQLTDMLRFGDFAWIARQNGNMTLKWTGA